MYFTYSILTYLLTLAANQNNRDALRASVVLHLRLVPQQDLSARRTPDC